jgi:hypothetical protein
MNVLRFWKQTNMISWRRKSHNQLNYYNVAKVLTWHTVMENKKIDKQYREKRQSKRTPNKIDNVTDSV